MKLTAWTDLDSVRAAVAAAASHPELPAPHEFSEGMNYWPTDLDQAVLIQEALDDAMPGKITWEPERSQHSRHIMLRGRVGTERVFTIWVPDL